MAEFSDTEKLNRAFKLSFWIEGTENSSPLRAPYEEPFPIMPYVVGEDVWADSVPHADTVSEADTYASDNVNYPQVTKVEMALTKKSGFNDKLWALHATPGDESSPILDNWLLPQKFGRGYTARLFQDDGTGNPGTEITTTEGSWLISYKAGFVLLASGHTATDEGWTEPLHIVCYRYTGAFGAGPGGNASDQPIHTPSDATWDDGFYKWNPSRMIKDALDDLNEIIADIAPQPPQSLDGQALIPSMTFYQAKLSANLSADWYSGGDSPGDTINNVTPTVNFDFHVDNETDAFRYGDKGLVVLRLNGTDIASIDNGANFVESDRDGDQDLTNWDNQGSGSPITNGVVALGSGNQFLVTYCGKYNNIKAYQKENINVHLVDGSALGVHEGRNIFQIWHDIDTDEFSQELVLFYDDDTNPITIVNPIISENTLSSSRYLSGIRYYSIGDQFDVSYSVQNLFNKTYHPTAPSEYSMEGITLQVKNPTTVPNYNDTFNVSETIGINDSDVMSIDARLHVVARDPFGNEVEDYSPSENRLVLTYEDGGLGQSTITDEYFTDEYYRLPLTYNFDDKTSSYENQWNSQTPLTDGNAQCFNDGNNPALVYPSIDFTTGYLPTQQAGTNYSGFISPAQYARCFIKVTASNATITLYGVSGGIDTIGNGDINVEIKLPTQTAWLDCAKPYSSTEGVDNDGDGCLAGSIDYSSGNAVIPVTFGGKSTYDSNNRIYLRITLRNSNRVINRINVS